MNSNEIHIGNNCHISQQAVLTGDVEVGEEVSVFYFSVLRGDNQKIRIGDCSNIQENCVLHCDHNHPIVIGRNVTIGHGVILHGCEIGNTSMIGMGSIIMDGAEIGEKCLIGAGSLVTSGSVIPPESLVYGRPARVIRKLSEREIEKILEGSFEYAEKGKELFG